MENQWVFLVVSHNPDTVWLRFLGAVACKFKVPRELENKVHTFADPLVVEFFARKALGRIQNPVFWSSIGKMPTPVLSE